MGYFVISFNRDVDKPESSEIEMSDVALDILFDALYDPLSASMSEDEGWALEYRNMHHRIKTQELSDLTPEAFNLAYDLIDDAIKKHDELSSYSDELIKKFKADPRYKAPSPA